MGILTKDEIGRRDDMKLEKVDVPEWGGEVYIRTIMGNERDMLDASYRDNKVGYRGLFAATVLCDEKGVRLFSDIERMQLGSKNARALDRILEAGMRLNGMTEDAITDVEKNSETVQSGDSG